MVTHFAALGHRRLLVIACLVLATSCSKAADTAMDRLPSMDAQAPGVVHVHGLGINPKDGALFAATHTGLFRIAEGKAVRVSNRYPDLMGFTVVGPDHFLASGHPDLRDYRAGTLPPLLGLIESTDGGQTWRPVSLLGQADFHVLQVAHGFIYGYDSTSSRLMVSLTGASWEQRATVALRDVVVHPAQAELVFGLTEQGLRRSQDGGRTWQPAAAPPLLLLAWPQPEQLWGLAADGVVFRSADAGETWQRHGQLPGTPAALLVAGSPLYAAIHQGGIYQSRDDGVSWQLLYRDPS
ncbi:MAG: hypothetical protein DCC57_16980 [Chloroflexi bacterium]|nr:MAG: hypothetical protein DCC57_16980 [Chloroflexota bacterium]